MSLQDREEDENELELRRDWRVRGWEDRQLGRRNYDIQVSPPFCVLCRFEKDDQECDILEAIRQSKEE